MVSSLVCRQLLTELVKQVVVLRASAQSVEALQGEVQRLGKQLRNERLKAAAMSEQLETPLNVHRHARAQQA